MTSAELKAARGQLVSNVETFISPIEGLSGPVATANKALSDTNDTLLKNEISSQGEKISQAITNGTAKVRSALSGALSQIDAKISDLEEQERIAAEKERIARLNAQKRALNSNKTTTNTVKMEIA